MKGADSLIGYFLAELRKKCHYYPTAVTPSTAVSKPFATLKAGPLRLVQSVPLPWFQITPVIQRQ